MSSIDLVAEHPHYRDHLLPIWRALPDEYRGTDHGRASFRRGKDPLLLAGFSDVNRHPDTPYVYVEHGAGQSYIGISRAVSPFYSGGEQHRKALAFICPNEEVADRWRVRYPDKPAFAVGSPRMDDWHSGLRNKVEPRTVAVTFHWDAQFTGVPETSSAFPYYFQAVLDAVVRWRADGWHVIGHNHPRNLAVAEFWKSEGRQIGVEYVERGDDVLDRASVLVADNTSMQAEFLSLGRRVVWINHDGYRRNVEHGGRFWKWPSLGGLQVDTPASLALLDLDSIPEATGHPYAFADGRAGQRAADAIVSLLSA